jgi:hypothetical protein
MQIQPPDRNNPSNPLYRVAALTLDKEYVKLDTKSTVRIIATLNFKRSHDLRGRTKTTSGEGVTVCFSLAIRRASFELTIFFEDNKPETSNITIRKIAHVTPLSTRHRISDSLSLDKQSARDRSLEGAIQGALGISDVSAEAAAAGKFIAKSGTKTTRTRRISGTTHKNNVTATFGSNIVHWELNASTALDKNDEAALTAWLEGEVFQKATGASLDACQASWKRDESRGLPVITGSVFTSMSDLIVGDIHLLTDLGQEIPVKKVEQSAMTSFPGFGALFNSDAKERVVKQVIRKHLVSQGMVTDGARVQICKASG